LVGKKIPTNVFSLAPPLTGGAQNWPKKYNIDYFECAVNLEYKFKLKFDQERWSKIEKKIKIQKIIE